MLLPAAPWRTREGLDRLLDALDARGGVTRFVGGAVRDTLAGRDVADVDCATRLSPEEVRDRIVAAGLKAVPTGLAHGTITAVLPSGPIEVTTLRRDVSTDGRHATVAFTDDWREDAARRDFTCNALFADPLTGEVFDYFEGLADLRASRVRFIGEPLRRIAEDHLRILRFFRFHARFGRGAPDADGLVACAARANDLMALSRERIADELLKLLALPDPAPTVAVMRDTGIFRPVLPEVESGQPRLDRLLAREGALGVAPDPLRRLAALLPPEPVVAGQVAARLKLSNAHRTRLMAAAVPARMGDRARRLRVGDGLSDAEVVDRLLLSDDLPDTTIAAELASLAGWSPPLLPIKGGELVALGLRAGPVVAATLEQLRRDWVAADFPDAEWVRLRARAAVDQALRDRR